MFARKALCFMAVLLLVGSPSMPALAEVIAIQVGEYPTLVAVGQVFSVAIDGLDYSGYWGGGTITLSGTGLNGTLQRTGSIDTPYGHALFDGLSYDLTADLGNHAITVAAVNHGNQGMTVLQQRVVAPDPVPATRIDFRDEKLTSLVAGRTYGVTLGGVYQGLQTADASGAIAIPAAWMTGVQGDFSIMQKGDGSTYPDSGTKVLTLPDPPAAPNPAPVGVRESRFGKNDGKITGVSTAMEWSGNNGTSWTACTGASVTGLAPGSYLVRIAPVQTSDLVGSFASPGVPVTIEARPAPTPTPIPKTGDNFPMGGLLALMGAMLVAMGWLGTRMRGGKSAA